MMHTIFLCLFLTGFCFHKAKSVGISSKLDFGDDKEKIITIQSPEKLSNFEILKSDGTTTVVCTTTGCNKTENEQKDIVSDVLVHVKTSVNIPKPKNETLQETPDIPVVLGYGRNNPHPEYNPENPVTSRPIYNNDRTTFSENTFVPAFQWKPQSQRKYYTPNYKQVSYENMLYIPYLEPSFHNYHYGEQPPLQYVWTPKDRAGFNPVEFKRLNDAPIRTRNQWNKPFNTHNTQGNTGVYTTCTCHNPGLNWYPTTPTWNIQTRNQNSHIDDKLGDLN